MIIALVDDNEMERSTSMPLFLQCCRDEGIPVHRFDFFSSGAEFLEHWKLGAYDLIVLDIEMGELSGIQVAEEIRRHNQDVRIVFCSSSNEYACESYSVGASFYIQKPVTREKLLGMLSRLNISDFELRRFVALPDGQRLLLRKMIWSEYSNHQITIHLTQGKITEMKVWMSQGQFAALLQPYDYFVACNKGSIINLHEVKSKTGDSFTMSDGSLVPISRRKAKEIDAQYRHFLLQSVRKELT